MLQLPFEQLVIVLAGVLAGLTVHELAHAWVALRLGDDTAKTGGRITLNPIRHIDPFGFVLLLVAGFGWAKPVVINREKLRNPRRDDILISLAGPFANLLLGFASLVVLRAITGMVPLESGAAKDQLFTSFAGFAWVNIGLFIFNLLPLPPLDGSHVVLNLLPPGSERVAARYFKYGTYALAAVILFENFTSLDILPIGRLTGAVMNWMFSLLWLY